MDVIKYSLMRFQHAEMPLSTVLLAFIHTSQFWIVQFVAEDLQGVLILNLLKTNDGPAENKKKTLVIY